MSKQLSLALCVIITTTVLLTACAPADAPTTAAVTAATAQPTMAAPTTAPVQPTSAPAVIASVPTTAAAQPEDSAIKVGLVTDIGGVGDHAFNQLAWEGIQRASADMGFQVKLIESTQITDYEANIDALAAEGYSVIITVGSSMGDATALKARQYANVRFAIIDNAYVSTPGSQACAGTVTDCYTDGGLTNVTSLMFAEDELGFLAGVLAGGMSRSGFVCSISSTKTSLRDRYVRSIFQGAVWQAGDDMRFMNNYINVPTLDNDVPSFSDSTQGKEAALRLISNGCDVVLGVAADGALLAAKENGLMAIGYNVDQYNTNPDIQSALLSSAQKNAGVAVYNYLRSVADSSVKGGISTSSLQDGGIGLAPFHDWDSQIPADLKAQIQRASDGIRNGSITIDLS